MSHQLMPPTRLVGVDFSGARQAGCHIFVAEGHASEEALCVTGLRRGDELPGSSPERAPALEALVRFITDAPCAAGLDFPFALPQDLMRQDLIRDDAPDWETWARSTAQFQSSEAFRDHYQPKGSGDAKRETDRVARAPFGPLNFRLFRQTYHGIRDVLAPCIEAGGRVLPLQAPQTGASWLLEICPASWLKREGLYQPYKGVTDKHLKGRTTICDAVVKREGLVMEPAIRQRALDDTGGDALDALLALTATHRALQQRDLWHAEPGTRTAQEGRIYY